MHVVHYVCRRRRIQHPVVHAADLFAILKTTEKLERAWTRDLISAKEYEPLCAKLIAQFKTLWSTLRSSVRRMCPCAVETWDARQSLVWRESTDSRDQVAASLSDVGRTRT